MTLKKFTWILALLISFSACKKGENDPFFSLKTRKGRLAGDWTVSFAEYSINDTTYTYDGSALSEKKGKESETLLTAEKSYSFSKEGRYSINTRTTFPAGYFDPNEPEITRVYLEEGIWDFTGGSNGTRNKSQLLLRPDRIENSVAGINDIDVVAIENPSNGYVVNLDMLKDKSMRWIYDYTENRPTGETRYTGTFEFSKQ